MSRPILSRPRTRVYGCNYDKGESYYKPTIANLDRKYSARPLFPEPRNSLADEIAARRSDIGSRDLAGTRQGALGRSDLGLDTESSFPSRRSALSDSFLDDEETVFDIRGQRTTRPRRHQQLIDDFADDVAATSSRLKSRLHISSESVDDKLSETMRGARAAFDEAETSFRRRATAAADSSDSLLDDFKPSLTKWSKLGESVEEEVGSSAASRAKQSRARLSDLEAEMEEMAEKQARRERRAAALRALIDETNSQVDDSLANSSKVSSSHSVHRSEKRRSRDLGGNDDINEDFDFYCGRDNQDNCEDEFLMNQRRAKERAAAAFEEDIAELRRKRRDIEDRMFDMIDLNAEIEKAKNTLGAADNLFQRHALRFDNQEPKEIEDPNMSLAERLDRARKAAAKEAQNLSQPNIKLMKLVPVEPDQITGQLPVGLQGVTFQCQ
uniref:Uncharacterized protein n=1 Tax=Trichogramma kaykai TaxID=54128 RepID=A0ABD2W6K7_9HYME